MYYVIAAQAPENQPQMAPEAIAQHIQRGTPMLAEQARNPAQQSTIHIYNVSHPTCRAKLSKSSAPKLEHSPNILLHFLPVDRLTRSNSRSVLSMS